MADERIDRLESAVKILEAGVRLYEAHVENLIERVYALEEKLERQGVRLAAVERATPLRGPKKAPPKQPPTRPVR